jgi:hypothetical protein
MLDPTETATARARAAEAILDRGWGKPAPYEQPSNEPSVREGMSDAEVDARIAQLLEALAPE